MITQLLQFIQAKGAGEAVLRRFLGIVGARGAEAAYDIAASAHSLEDVIGIKEDVARNIVEAKDSALSLADELRRQAIDVVWIGMHSYPERLLHILGRDAPPVLFVAGNQDVFAAPAVGFCGSRRASPKGLEITARCAARLASDGTCVVSGYAHGVDMAAHCASIENGGTTVIVLVEGILRFQPKREIAELLSPANYVVVSQFPPGLPWSGRNAMKRNSTIIGLSDAMILVESGLTGGTFAAGEETLKRRQPLFVIDYADPGPSAEANPHFIEKGGVPIRGNRDRVPNLANVRAAVSKQIWRNATIEELTLFDPKPAAGTNGDAI